MLGKNLALHHGSNASIPIEEWSQVVVRVNLAPVDRRIGSHDPQPVRRRQALIERSDQRIQLLIKTRRSAHLLHRRIPPDMLHLGKRHVLARNIPVEHRLVPHIPTLNHKVVHQPRKPRLTHQRQDQIIHILLPMRRRHRHHLVRLKSLQDRRNRRLSHSVRKPLSTTPRRKLRSARPRHHHSRPKRANKHHASHPSHPANKHPLIHGHHLAIRVA